MELTDVKITSTATTNGTTLNWYTTGVPSSSIQLAGGVPALHPERKGQLNISPLKNWIEKHGGLPTYINSVATALLREHPEWGISRIIATAVNWAKKTCATGKAFGGKVSVSKAVQAAACNAVRQWESKKAAASEDIDKALLELNATFDIEAVPEWFKHLTLRAQLRGAGVEEIPKAIALSDELFMLVHYELDLSEYAKDGEEVNDLLDPHKFMEMAEAAAYAESLVRFPVMEMSDITATGDNMYRKVIVKASKIKYQGKEISFDASFMKEMVNNFNSTVAGGEYIPLQFVKDDNQHTEDPRYYGGVVKKLELDDPENPTCVTAIMELGAEAKKVVDAQPNVGVSIGAGYLALEQGRPVNPVLKHVAMTHRPKLKGMSSWESMIKQSEYGEELTIDLSDAEVEVMNTTPKEGGNDMADTQENGQKVELTEEMLSEILASEAVKAAIAEQVTTKVEAETTALKSENEALRGQVGEIRASSYEKAVELAVESYATHGVPKILRDLAQGLLLTYGEDTSDTPEIVLSEGEGEGAKEIKLSRYDAVLRILDEAKGFVNMTPEQGSGEDVELSATLTGDDRQAAIDTLLGRAKANR